MKYIRDKKKIDSKELELLLSSIALNDTTAFMKLYQLTKSAVYGYSLSILNNHEDALDNTQDVFIKIYESIDKYKSQNKPMNWIFTITKNLALMKLRKKERNQKEELKEEIFINNNNPSEEDKIIIKSLIEKLTDEEKQILLLHIVGGLKHIEIAKMLGLNLSTSISKYHRAIKKLEKEWSEN